MLRTPGANNKKKILSILILLERGSETALNFEIDLSKYIQKYLKLKLLTKNFFFFEIDLYMLHKNMHENKWAYLVMLLSGEVIRRLHF